MKQYISELPDKLADTIARQLDPNDSRYNSDLVASANHVVQNYGATWRYCTMSGSGTALWMHPENETTIMIARHICMPRFRLP